MLHKVKVEIGGNVYSITSAEQDAYVLGLAKDIDTQINLLLKQGPKLSYNDALVLVLLNYTDLYKKSEKQVDTTRFQLTQYIEDAARTRIELDETKRELERVRRQLEATGRERK